MSYKETDIKHENGPFWVLNDKNAYTILKTGSTHSVSIEAYPKTEDGLSIAIYRCNYLAKKSKP